MLITAIDPGPRTSGVVRYNSRTREVLEAHDAIPRRGLLLDPTCSACQVLVVEQVSCYGQRIGRQVMATIELVGAIAWQVERDYPLPLVFVRFTRPEVVHHFTGQRNAPEGQVNAALYDRFGGSRKAAMGTVKNPGPLHGVKGHALDALALAIAFAEGLRPKDDDAAAVESIPLRPATREDVPRGERKASVGDAVAAVGGCVLSIRESGKGEG